MTSPVSEVQPSAGSKSPALGDSERPGLRTTPPPHFETSAIQSSSSTSATATKMLITETHKDIPTQAGGDMSMDMAEMFSKKECSDLTACQGFSSSTRPSRTIPRPSSQALLSLVRSTRYGNILLALGHHFPVQLESNVSFSKSCSV